MLIPFVLTCIFIEFRQKGNVKVNLMEVYTLMVQTKAHMTPGYVWIIGDLKGYQ